MWTKPITIDLSLTEYGPDGEPWRFGDVEALDELVQATGRDQSFIMRQALRSYYMDYQNGRYARVSPVSGMQAR